MRACLKHLEAKTSTGEPYYKKVDDSVLNVAKSKITNIVQEAFDNEVLSKEEYQAMLPSDDEVPIPGRFYCTFKVHKSFEEGKAPPPRGIVSCSGTVMENIAIYVEHHIQQLGQNHETYLQDTPDFLRYLETFNDLNNLENNAMLVVIDVIGLYDNIPPEEGVTCAREGLKEQSNLKVPSELITRLLTIIQEYSVFEFDNKKYQRSFGTTMGSKPAPPYANNFMARKIDKKMLEIAEKYIEDGDIPLKFFKRFLDDIFF